MRAGRFILSPLLLTGVSLLAAAAVNAYPGGSGGSMGSGGQSPSTSAPMFDAAEYRAGIEALKAEKFAAARKSFAKVLSVAPGDANSNYLAGVASVGLNDLKGAVKYFEKAVKANPDLVPARQDLAIALARLGDRSKAEAELAKLKQSQAKCASSCAQAADLASAIAAVTAAIKG